MADNKSRAMTGRQPVDEERKELFLAELRRNGGLFAAAAKVASPHLKGKQAGYSAFQNLRARDPHFNSQVETVLQEVREEVVNEIRRRGQEGIDKPIFQGGKRATDHDGRPASVREYSDKLLLARARHLLPEEYGEKVRHDHYHKHTVNSRWFIDADVIDLLPEDMADQLYQIVRFLDQRQRELANVTLPQDETVEDAEYVEVLE